MQRWKALPSLHEASKNVSQLLLAVEQLNAFSHALGNAALFYPFVISDIDALRLNMGAKSFTNGEIGSINRVS